MSLKLLIFLACIPSGGALLAKVYGLAEMQTVTIWLFFPAAVVLAAIYQKSKKKNPLISQSILLGAIGGLIGTFGYDLIRVPFMLTGQRVFAPISAYGVWLLDAEASSRFTLVAGWAYHFANGITFGIMYSIWMRGKHWVWAVAWAMILETIAVVSPFGSIFAIRQAYGALGVAYLGHLAYGIPLGLIVRNGDFLVDWFESVPVSAKSLAFVVLLLALASPILNPNRIASDSENTMPHSLLAQENSLNPDWVRLRKAEQVTLRNNGESAVSITNKTLQTTYSIPANSKRTVRFPRSGIYQFFVETERRSRSSFVIVEPIHE